MTLTEFPRLNEMNTLQECERMMMKHRRFRPPRFRVAKRRD